jgi:hypothetical protein
MAKLSTGLRDHMLATGSLKAGIDGGVIRVYSGTPPATADAALSGNTLLDVISLNATGAGISMAAASSAGVLGKNTGEVWRGLVVATATATFYRFSGLADDGTLSTVTKRIQGTVGVVGADLNFSDVNFVAGPSNYKSIESFNIAMPTA